MFFFGKRKIILAMMIFAVMGLCGWFWRHRESIPFVSQPLSIAAAPFQYGASRVSFGMHTGIEMLDQILGNWKELETLRRENGALRAEQTAYSEILAENMRLRALAGFKQGYTQFTLLGARVISRDIGKWTNTVTIDRGTDSGLARYMPVIVPEGLVGFVSEVYLNSARVQLVTDPRTSVSALVQRPSSRVASMANGNGNRTNGLIFDNLSREADIVKGDVLITSGYGGVYPHGLLVGYVTEVTDDTASTAREAYAVPAADLSRLEDVFIIMSSIEKTAPEAVDTSVPKMEPPMNPNEEQAGVS